MAVPEQIPLGLRQLMPLSQVLIRQKTTLFTGNKYVVLAPDSKTVIFYAKEESNVLGQMLSGNNRSFHIDIFDTQDQPVVTLRRPYTFGADKMEVNVGGRAAAVVRREVTLMKPVLSINSDKDRPVLRVKGPLSTVGKCDFDVFTLDKRAVGVIRKKWAGLRELVTDTDNFSIHFPADLDVRYKAALIGTCFLIDFLFYEN